jgi:hypothetical protein
VLVKKRMKRSNSLIMISIVFKTHPLGGFFYVCTNFPL